MPWELPWLFLGAEWPQCTSTTLHLVNADLYDICEVLPCESSLNNFTGTQRGTAVQEGWMLNYSLCCILNPPHIHERCHLCSWENGYCICNQPLYVLHNTKWKPVLHALCLGLIFSFGKMVFPIYFFFSESRAYIDWGTVKKGIQVVFFFPNRIWKFPAKLFSLMFLLVFQEGCLPQE